MIPFTANEALLIDTKFFGLICFVVAVSYVNAVEEYIHYFK